MKKLLLILVTCSSIVFSQEQGVWMHPNRGQWHESIRYKMDLTDGEFLVEDTKFTFLFHNVGELIHSHNHDLHETPESYHQHVVFASFIGANNQATKVESNPSTHYRNYFIGTDSTKWKGGIHSLGKIIYQDFYNGIDLQMSIIDQQFNYTFILDAQAESSLLKMKFDGASAIYKQNQDLVIQHSLGKIHFSAPKAWNIDQNGKKIPVAVVFKLNQQTLGFEFPNGYNKQQALVIDPDITFSSYTGSSVDNWGCSATPDNLGNLFAAGTVFGSGYPITAGALDASFNGGNNVGYSAFDIGISKFNATGTAFLYSTYLGGNGNEAPSSMIANAANELYVMGATSSTNFPMAGTPYDASFNGGSLINFESSQAMQGSDLFVVRFNLGGTALLNATYVGGSGNDGVNPGSSGSTDGDLVFNYGDNFRGEIVLDASGNVYVASSTRSSNFPTVNAAQAFLSGQQDAVLFKMPANLSSLTWSTYYGASNLESGNAVAISSTGEVYLTGGTNSNGLNTPGGHATVFLGGSADGYIARFSAAGTLLSGTYVGTNQYDNSFFVQIDLDDAVYVYGQTEGVMPISTGLYGNAAAMQFIRKYNSNLSAVVWNTKVGGSGQKISPTAFLVSNCYEIYISGWGGDILNTNISNFPVTADAFQTIAPNGDAFYIAVYDPDASGLQYATFIGGAAHEHVDGGTSRFDKQGRIYHAVCAACGGNPTGFVNTPGVISPQNQSTNCNLAAFKFELNSINALVTEPNFIICIPQPVQFFNNSTEGNAFYWEFGDGTNSNDPNPSHVYTQTGEFTVKLVVSDSLGCKAPDSTEFVVNVGSFQAGAVTPPPTICRGAPYQFDAFGGVNYLWSPSNVLDDPTIPNPTATIFQNTDFSVIISDTCGIDTVFVTLNVFQDSMYVSPDTSICLGFSTPIEVFGTISQIWTPPSFISSTVSSNPTVSPQTSTYYVVSGTTQNNCMYEDSVFVEVFFDPPTPVLEDTITICEYALEEITVSGASTYAWSPNYRISTLVGPTVTVSPLVDFTYYCNFTNACGTVLDSVFVDVVKPQIRAYRDTTICLGDTVMLNAIGTDYYSWSPSTGLTANTGDTVYAFPQLTTQYTVIGTDLLGCKDTSTVRVSLFPTHQVNAGSTIYASLGDLVELNATANAPGEFLWSPPDFLTCTTCSSPIANPNYNYSYSVYFTDTNGCITKDIVAIQYEGVIYIPNTFTPDGSRFNEVFKAYGEGIKDFEMLIFNRWGELICTLNSMDEYWDGTYKGKMCQDGTYTWKLTYTDITGVYKTIAGHVNLLK